MVHISTNGLAIAESMGVGEETGGAAFAKCDASFIKEPGNAAGILTYKAFFFFKDYPVPQDEASGNCEIATDN